MVTVLPLFCRVTREGAGTGASDEEEGEEDAEDDDTVGLPTAPGVEAEDPGAEDDVELGRYTAPHPASATDPARNRVANDQAFMAKTPPSCPLGRSTGVRSSGKPGI
jgi:hypothetical protein